MSPPRSVVAARGASLIAINLSRNDVDIRQVELLLGHRSIATTQIYLTSMIQTSTT